MTTSTQSSSAGEVHRRTLLARLASPVKTVGGWAACVLATVIHALALSLLSPDDTAATTLRDWALLMLPALITVIAMPSTLRHWKRWLAFAGVMLISSPAWTLYALVVAESWVLHREWVVDAYHDELARLSPRWLRRRRPALERSGKGRPTPKAPQNRARRSSAS